MHGTWQINDGFADIHGTDQQTWARCRTASTLNVSPQAEASFPSRDTKQPILSSRSIPLPSSFQNGVFARKVLTAKDTTKRKLQRMFSLIQRDERRYDIESNQPLSPDTSSGARPSSPRRRPTSPKTVKQTKPEDCSWMFAFDLPSAVSSHKKKGFRRNLRSEGVRAAEILESAFKTVVDKKHVQIAMEAPFPGDQHREEAFAKRLSGMVTSKDPLLVKPTKQSPASRDEDYDYSLPRALQCTIELVLAFFEQVLNDSCKEVLELTEEPVSTSVFTSLDGETLYLCVRINSEVAELIAATDDYPVQLSKEGVAKLGITISGPTSYAHVQYDPSHRELCQRYPDKNGSVLRQVDRIRILYDKVTDYVNLSLLKTNGLLADSSPLHHQATMMSLRRRWGNLSLLFRLHQPLEEVRDYFGEEIALYFHFVHDLIFSLLWLLIPGLITAAYVDLVESGYARPIFSILILLWYRLFTKRWQQQQKLLALRWGVSAHKTSTLKELPNSRFQGELRPSPINEDDDTLQVSKVRKTAGRIVSVIVTVLFVLVLLLALAVEHVFFYNLKQTYATGPMSSVISSLFGCWCGCQIKTVDSIWDAIGTWITDHEYRAHESTFNKSKRVKATAVKLITSTSSMLFFAFVQPALTFFYQADHWRGKATDMEHDRQQLRFQLLALFITRYIFLAGTAHDIIKPLAALKMHEYQKGDTDESLVELQANMCEYTNTDLTDDWLDILLPLGLAVFFGMIAPWVMMLLLIILLIQVRTDAWKLLHVYRRPYPRLAEDVGCFGTTLGLFGYIMIVTNVGILSVEFGGVLNFAPKCVLDVLGSTTPGWHEKALMESFAFLFTVSALSVVWRFLDFTWPDDNDFLRLEQRRQTLQRHRLFYWSDQPDLKLRRLSFKGRRPGKSGRDDDGLEREDFSQVENAKHFTNRVSFFE